jgi:hypothetical protein
VIPRNHQCREEAHGQHDDRVSLDDRRPFERVGKQTDKLKQQPGTREVGGRPAKQLPLLDLLEINQMPVLWEGNDVELSPK